MPSARLPPVVTNSFVVAQPAKQTAATEAIASASRSAFIGLPFLEDGATIALCGLRRQTTLEMDFTTIGCAASATPSAQARVPGVAKLHACPVTQRRTKIEMRRFTRLSNRFSKKLESHRAAVALWASFYNLCRVHETLRCTPAMALGVSDHIWTIGELVQAALEPRDVPPLPQPTPQSTLRPGYRPLRLIVGRGGKGTNKPHQLYGEPPTSICMKLCVSVSGKSIGSIKVICISPSAIVKPSAIFAGRERKMTLLCLDSAAKTQVELRSLTITSYPASLNACANIVAKGIQSFMDTILIGSFSGQSLMPAMKVRICSAVRPDECGSCGWAAG